MYYDSQYGYQMPVQNMAQGMGSMGAGRFLQQPPTQPQQQAMSGNGQPGFFCRPVASREEALGVPVDFMGAPMFFPDLSRGVIYMKRFNTSSGSADVYEFRVQERSEPAPQAATAMVSLDEIRDMKDAIDILKKEVEGLKRSGKTEVKIESANQ